MKRRITEYLDLDTATLEWACNRCGQSLGPAAKNYKEGCLIADRDPREIWQPFIDASFNFAYNPSCAYSDAFICPLAPVANRLPVPVRAGEQAPLPVTTTGP